MLYWVPKVERQTLQYGDDAAVQCSAVQCSAQDAVVQAAPHTSEISLMYKTEKFWWARRRIICTRSGLGVAEALVGKGKFYQSLLYRGGVAS